MPTIAGGTSTGRGVPDVAGNADPVTGYLVVVDGKQQPIGGTSAVAPLWAGLIARLAQATGKKFGLLQPLIYAGVTPGAAAQGFNDITQGNNGAYRAGPGWDASTGLGSPNGQALLTLLSDPPPQTATVTTEKPAQARTGGRGSTGPHERASMAHRPCGHRPRRSRVYLRARGTARRHRQLSIRYIGINRANRARKWS